MEAEEKEKANMLRTMHKSIIEKKDLNKTQMVGGTDFR
jgi:hypothetical protein